MKVNGWCWPPSCSVPNWPIRLYGVEIDCQCGVHRAPEKLSLTLFDTQVVIKMERAILTDILELYKDFRCLWDTSDEDYYKKHKKQEALSTMLNRWKEIDGKANHDTVKKKLDNMRTTFFREWKKVSRNMSIPSMYLLGTFVLFVQSVTKVTKFWYFVSFNNIFQ